MIGKEIYLSVEVKFHDTVLHCVHAGSGNPLDFPLRFGGDHDAVFFEQIVFEHGSDNVASRYEVPDFNFRAGFILPRFAVVYGDRDDACLERAYRGTRHRHHGARRRLPSSQQFA